MPPILCEFAFVPLISVEHMMALIRRPGTENVQRALADEIEEDFKRWESFDMTAHVGGHSDVGVFEVTPTSDGEMYRLKCVNGHSKISGRFPDRDGVRTSGGCEDRSSEAIVRDDAADGA